ncbi:MAG TPA: response regulator [Planctomycetota bacterium]|nr:response regulator [Planctomycetota bacterium]
MPKRILVVDDTKSIREIVSYLLRSRGYEVMEASDGEEAWEIATTESPDLIVLDAMIPKKTGFEICEALKTDDRWRRIPILMLTAMTRDSGKPDEYWREKSKADDFVSKPFKAPDLVQRVIRLLGPDASPPAG